MTLTPGAAHAGFLDRAKTIPLEYFRRLLVRGERVVLTGHSLGGAVASLLALRYNNNVIWSPPSASSSIIRI
jgi:putative lipase involved disintegration of autophagic bodies